MNKTLLNHFTVIQSTQGSSADKMTGQDNSLQGLVRELKQVLLQAEHELLSPRDEAIEQLLSKALN